ncbi:MAG: hypothetical protein ABIT71_07940 [Vicinamibacteraceae bacterium]
MRWWPLRRWRAESWVDDRARAERRQRGRRRVGRLLGILGLLLIGGPGAFIGIICSGGGSQSPRELIAPFPMPARDESLTFLTVPERLVVAQTDEYGRHLAQAPASTFPHFSAARDYWGAVNTACGVTTQEYSFNAGQQITLGVLGAGHTAEQVLKGAYEGSLGRFTEWLFSTDTPEDRFAGDTVRELARFERGAPWQQFPFGARLQQLWSATPLWGPHVLRKWERRVVFSVEYGVKALLASAARLLAATPADKDTARLHAWVGGATPAVLQANGADIVSIVGPGSFIVTLPRGEAFTRSLIGLIGGGVKVLDVAGNDEIALTAIVRSAPNGAASTAPEEAPPAGRVLSTVPLLTDPSARRLTVRTPLARLAETAAWLQRRGAVLEQLYDY